MPNDLPHLIVGIGASAGGLEELQRFFSQVPAQVTMTFLVVQHLSPDHPSTLAAILTDAGPLDASQATEGEPLQPGHIHVIQPGTSLTIKDGTVHCGARDNTRPVNRAVDDLFESIAVEAGEYGVCIVLSGAGSDGSAGVESIKQNGGLALAQRPESARHASMPTHAEQTGLVDAVLEVEDMVEYLMTYQSSLGELTRTEQEPQAHQQMLGLLNQVCDIVSESTGHDFHEYKKTSLARRVQRRVQALDQPSLQAYVETLRTNADETQRLFQDLLISVTAFFRNPSAFEQLAERIPELFDGRSTGQRVRVWVPGCASGEEAYSIAILLAEHAATLDDPPDIQIFATDIDATALKAARVGRYPHEALGSVSEERRSRWFRDDESGVRVNKAIRELCIFTVHNVISDPPYPNLDLISCRNLLIYLDSSVQRRLMPVFHYALREGGVLLLGPSEDVSGTSALFTVEDRSARLFRRTAGKTPTTAPRPAYRSRMPDWGSSAAAPRESADALARRLNSVFLEAWTPPAVIVDNANQIRHFFGRTSEILSQPPGAPQTDLLQLLPSELRLAVRSLLHRCRSSGTEQTQSDLSGNHQRLTVTAAPLTDSELPQDSVLVVFEAKGSVTAPVVTAGSTAPPHVIAALERELQGVRGELQTVVEQLETSNEDLKGSNEELMSMNEELQSSNEELQTSKEELQSVNEELETVNDELKNKVLELDRLNADLQNLFESTGVATLFLDREWRIHRYTPACKALFNLIPSDIGRPLSDITKRFDHPDLQDQIEQVQRSLTPLETQVQGPNSKSFTLRIHPYRTVHDAIDGVVMTFSNVTELERARSQLTRREAELADFFDNAITGLFILGNDGCVENTNRWLQRSLGYEHAQLAGFPVTELFADDAVGQAIFDELRAGSDVISRSVQLCGNDGKAVYARLSANALSDADGDFVRARCFVEDITESVRAEELLRVIVDSLPVMVAYLGPDQRFRLVNKRHGGFLGMPLDTAVGQRPSDALGEAFEPMRAAFDRAFQGKEVSEQLLIPLAGNGEAWIHLDLIPDLDDNGQLRGLVGLGADITTVKETEAKLREANASSQQQQAALLDADLRKNEFLAMLSHELRNPLGALALGLATLGQLDIDRTGPLGQVEKMLNRQTKALDTLVRDLLDASRIAHGKVQLEREPLNLAHKLRQIRADYADRVQTAKLHVAMNLAKGCWVHADRARITQVFVNLLDNACKYVPQDGRLTVDLSAEDDEVVIRFEDNGVGMDEDTVAHVFDLFSQGPRALARSGGGLGIGLHTVSHLVALHGGTIQVTSEGLGRGSCFVVRLPRIDRPLDAEVSEDATPVPIQTEGLSILVVDDNEDLQRGLTVYLRARRHVVHAVGDGISALAQVRALRPDVVLLDIGLPGMDGFEVATRIRQDPRYADMTLIAITGYTDDAARARSAEVGIQHHLTKPVDLPALRGLLEAVMVRAA